MRFYTKPVQMLVNTLAIILFVANAVTLFQCLPLVAIAVPIWVFNIWLFCVLGPED